MKTLARIVLSTTVALAGALLCASPGFAGPGKIVYTNGPNGQVVSINPDGTGQTPLTTNFLASEPALSPDGQWVAFQGSNTIGGPPFAEGIWVMKAEPMSATNVPVRVVNGTSYGYRMSWHPNGLWLAFTIGANSQIFVLPVLDGSGQVTPESGGNPKTAVTTNTFQFSEDPAFSPDGRYLAYASQYHFLKLLRVTDDSGNLTPESGTNTPTIVSLNGGSDPYAYRPSWNHDGTKLVFEHVQYDASLQNPQSAIAVLTVRDGSGNVTPEHVTNNPRVLYTAEVAGARAFRSPTWSPDGSLIAFVPPATSPDNPGVFKINASGPEHATNNPSVRVSPTNEIAAAPSFAQPGGVLLSNEPAPVPSNIVAWYPGDYTAGDIVGAHHAALQNNTSVVPGKVGPGLHFDGAVDYAIVGDAAELNITGNITIEAWIKPETVGGGTRAIVSKKNNNDAMASFYFNIQNDGRLSFSAQNADNTFFNALSTSTIPAGVFSHVAATQRGNTVTLYRNGAVIGTLTTDVLRPATPSGQMIIGAKRTQLTPSNQLVSFFHGVIDELTIYDRALTDDEIAGIFAAGANGKLRDDAARGFIRDTNTTGQLWSYGFFPSATPTTFTLLPTPALTAQMESWVGPTGNLPDVAHNFSDTIFNPTGGGGTEIRWGPGQLSQNPSSINEPSIIRWTAPEAGSYAVSASFHGLDAHGASTDVHVVHNTTEIFNAFVSGFFEYTDRDTEVRTVAAGDTIDFIVGPGGNGHSYDNTGVFASVVKLPTARPVIADPENFSITFDGSPMSGRKWAFRAVQPDTDEHAGRMSLRVQYSATPNDAGSWQDLPGGELTPPPGHTWLGEFTNIPVGSFAFRIVTSVAGVGERATAASQIYNIAAPAPQLELVAEVSAASDPTGATAHRSDLMTYKLKYRNVGALPATNLLLYAHVPRGVQVRTKPKGTIKTANKATGGTNLTWKIPALDPSAEYSEKTFTALILQPLGSLEPVLNVIGTDITTAVTFGNVESTLSAPPLNLATTIVNPLAVTAAQFGGANPVKPGAFVSFNITLTNKASYTPDSTLLKVTPPAGLVLQEGLFLDADGQPTGAPIDPISGKQVKLKGRASNPSSEEDAAGNQVAYFGIGRMLPGAVQKMRVTFRVIYDWDIADAIVFANATGSWKTPASATITTTNAAVPLTLQAADPGAPKPNLQLILTQEAAGALPGDRSVVVVTQGGFAVPDALPKRRSNQILYRLTYANIGTAVANFVRMAVLIPENTTYVKGSAKVTGASGDTFIPAAPKLKDGALIFNVPFLEPNFPTTAGSAKTLQFMVTVKPRTPVGTRITNLGGTVASRERVALGAVMEPKFAEVVPPANMTYTADSLAIDMTAGSQVRHRYFYLNQGGITARGVGIRYTIPPGLKFKSANFCDAKHFTAPNGVRKIPNPPDENATSGEVFFDVGNVAPGGFGWAQVILEPDPTSVPNGSTAQTTPDGAFRADGQWVGFDASSGVTATALAERGTRGSILPRGIYGRSPARFRDPTLGTTFIMVGGPAVVYEGDEFIYQVAWGCTTDASGGAGSFTMPIPNGVSVVVDGLTPDGNGRYTLPGSRTQNFNGSGFPLLDDNAIYIPPGNPDTTHPNGHIIWITSAPPHSVKVANVRVRVNAGFTGEIKCEKLRLGLDTSGTIYNTLHKTRVLATGTALEDGQFQVYATVTDQGGGNAMGTAALPGDRFIATAKQISANSTNITVAGADFAHVKGSGAIAIPLGGGNMVAAGGLNLVAAGGGNMVAAGGLNMVAAGAGNAVSVSVPGSGFVTGSTLIPSIPSMVAAGGLNLIAGGPAGAGNLIRKSALIGQDGGSLIGLDGGSLIGLDGGSLGTFSIKDGVSKFTPAAGAQLALAANAASIVAAGAGNIVAAGAGNIVAVGGMNALPAATLVGNAGNTLVGNNGNSLVGNAGNTLVGNAGNTFTTGNAASQVKISDGGNFVGGGSGILPSGAGG